MKTNTAQHESGWPQRSDYRRSIRFEFSAYISGLILVIMVATGYIISREYVQTVSDNAVAATLLQARSYSGPAAKHMIASESPDALYLSNICQRLATDNDEVYWAGITDREGRFLAHTDIKRVVAGDIYVQAPSGKGDLKLRDGEAFATTADTIYTSVPISQGETRLGTLAVASSGRKIEQARTESMVSVASATLAMLLLGLPVTMLILSRKLRPLTIITETLQQVDLENPNLETPVNTRNELGYLSQTLEVMGHRLGEAQQALIEKERMARDLEIARKIQSSLLPNRFPQSEQVEISGAYRSAMEVGGDYYDFLELDQSRTAFLVADVSGKSLPGMLVMLMTRDLVRNFAREITNPASLMSRVNSELKESIQPGMFVTMFYGVLHKDTGLLTFVSAGHNPLIKICGKTGEIEQLRPKGFPLGLMPPEAFEQRLQTASLMLGHDDWLVQYTDGVNEAQNSRGEEFGTERLIDHLKTSVKLPPSELVKSVLDCNARFVKDQPQFDDITLVAMKWIGKSVPEQDQTIMEPSHAS